jgi:hypothetical protein
LLVFCQGKNVNSWGPRKGKKKEDNDDDEK